MQVNELRQVFLDFFEKHGHTIVKSSSLIPHGDNTLLFTNAGMNQFKDVFLGLEKREYSRATSAQKCVRAGGKHNDLENVGYTARHHTFFEMLGNFSFGDYFKLEAIKLAWEFLTQVLKLPRERLYVTVYKDDDEAYKIWQEVIGLEESRIIKIGDKVDGGSDNFWQMGETGPCGPCTEIFYDHGEEVAGGLPGSENEDGDRYIEIWNCVFMQFNRDDTGDLKPLPKPSVDTGMGIERIAAVMQGVHSNYDIDLFAKLIKIASEITGCVNLNEASLKVIADHIRSIGFLIADGVIPSNEGRGYVLRRIIRRAVRHGYKLGMNQPFLYLLVDALVDLMGDAYNELQINEKNIKHVLQDEEQRFFDTITNGMKLLEDAIAKASHGLDGLVAFTLYDTYGFPLDLTEDVCRERNLTVDVAGFDAAMEKQKRQAKEAGKFKMNQTFDYNGVDSQFEGYDEDSAAATIVAIYKNNANSLYLKAGEEGVIVLDRTPFYAESGGQIGDQGVLTNDQGANFAVSDTQKIRKEVIGHFGVIKGGELTVGMKVLATIDSSRRLSLARNHSATHLLHAALRRILGSHIEQRGSLVRNDYLRFDFSHNSALTNKEIIAVEQLVNQAIRQNCVVDTKNTDFDSAIASGAMALFGEKYADTVRVVSMGEFSTELCGGTHVRATGDIGFFTITSENGVANGIRRIEACSGEIAIKIVQNNMQILDKLRLQFKAQSNDDISEKIGLLVEDGKNLAKQLSQLKNKLFLLEAKSLVKEAKALTTTTKLLQLEFKDNANSDLLILMDKLKEEIGSGVIVLINISNNKCNFIVGVTNDLSNNYHAGKIVAKMASIINGKGGGKPLLALGGGEMIDKLPELVQTLPQLILNHQL